MNWNKFNAGWENILHIQLVLPAGLRIYAVSGYSYRQFYFFWREKSPGKKLTANALYLAQRVVIVDAAYGRALPCPATVSLI